MNTDDQAVLDVRKESLRTVFDTLAKIEAEAATHRIEHRDADGVRVLYGHALDFQRCFTNLRRPTLERDAVDEELDRLLPRVQALRDDLREMLG